MFSHSSIHKKITEGTLLPDTPVTINNTSVPLYLIGDSAYPLQAWLMKPFSHGTGLTPQQNTFNYRISRARIVVENAYGRLKSRWRRLMKRNDKSIENIPNIITAACILHNVCEIHKDSMIVGYEKLKRTHHSLSLLLLM